jgi:hypothetical protein
LPFASSPSFPELLEKVYVDPSAETERRLLLTWLGLTTTVFGVKVTFALDVACGSPTPTGTAVPLEEPPDDLDGLVVEVVLAAASGSALTAGLMLALKASVEPPIPASNEAAQTMAMLGIAKRLAAFLGRVIEPTFRRAKRQCWARRQCPELKARRNLQERPF